MSLSTASPDNPLPDAGALPPIVPTIIDRPARAVEIVPLIPIAEIGKEVRIETITAGIGSGSIPYIAGARFGPAPAPGFEIGNGRSVAGDGIIAIG